MADAAPATKRRMGPSQKRDKLIRGLKAGKALDVVLLECDYSAEHRSRLRHDPEIRAIERESQGHKFLNLVPLALKAMKESLESPNERVKADMSKFVMKESGVLAELQQAEKEGRQPNQAEIVAAMTRLEGLMEGAKQAQEQQERTIEHEPDQ